MGFSVKLWQVKKRAMASSSSLIKYTKSLRSCPRTPFDAILVLSDGSQLLVHKVILAANSKFFDCMLTYESSATDLIPLHKVIEPVMNEILEYFYCRQFSDDFFDELGDRNGYGRQKLAMMEKQADFLLATKLQSYCKKVQNWLQWTDNRTFPFQCSPYSRGHFLSAIKNGHIMVVPE